MTKPTYSELEAENLRVWGLLQRQWISVEERLPEDGVGVIVWRNFDLAGDTDQVQWDVAWLDYDTAPPEWVISGEVVTNISHWQPLPDRPNFPQSSSLVSSGAESADIGKLDMADKKADV